MTVAEVSDFKQKTILQQGLKRIGELFTDSFRLSAKKYGKDKVEVSDEFLSIIG